MSIEAVISSGAPVGPGPYSPAIRAGNLIFVSAQSPIDPKTHEIQGTAIEVQTRRALDNVKALLEDAGAGFHRIVKVNAYLSDPADYDRFNQVYESYFDYQPQPARTTVSVQHIWDASQRIKIECIAYVGD